MVYIRTWRNFVELFGHLLVVCADCHYLSNNSLCFCFPLSVSKTAVAQSHRQRQSRQSLQRKSFEQCAMRTTADPISLYIVQQIIALCNRSPPLESKDIVDWDDPLECFVLILCNLEYKKPPE